MAAFLDRERVSTAHQRCSSCCYQNFQRRFSTDRYKKISYTLINDTILHQATAHRGGFLIYALIN